MDTIFVVGHKSPDLDSVAAAIAYAGFLNTFKQTDIYQPAVCGEMNKETEYVLDKFGIAQPMMISGAANKKVILVDHNEPSQSPDSIEQAEIEMVVDHHKIDFKYSEPIMFETRPWGATCTIIWDIYKTRDLPIDNKLAGLMLSAILIDTVITKSPTCTDIDKKAIEDLAKIAGVEDWQKYGMELFKIRSNVADLPVDEIIKSDFKDFELRDGKFGVGQVETVDIDDFNGRENELIEALTKLRNEGDYYATILFITDIIKEGSRFYVSTNDVAKMETALGAKLENNSVYIDGVLSRKKQVLPSLTEVFDK